MLAQAHMCSQKVVREIVMGANEWYDHHDVNILDGEASSSNNTLFATPSLATSLKVIFSLSLIPPVSFALGLLLTGGMPMSMAIGIAVKAASVIYLINTLTVFLLGVALTRLAPLFGGSGRFEDGITASAYAFAGLWFSGPMLLVWPEKLQLWASIGFGAGVVFAFQRWPLIFRTPAKTSAGLIGLGVVVWVLIFLIVRSIIGPLFS